MDPRDVVATNMRATATFSPCGAYRYTLARQWGNEPPAIFVMLNPSTADAATDDPTIRRCVGFARRWHLDGIVVVNLFALRATDPRALRDHPDPVGPENDDRILAALEWYQSSPVVAAWGAHGGLYGRDRAMLGLIRDAVDRPLCLGTTRSGHPRHPLYLPADTVLMSYEGVTGEPAPGTG